MKRYPATIGRNKWIPALLALSIGFLMHSYSAKAASTWMDELSIIKNSEFIQADQPSTIEETKAVTVTIHTVIDASSDSYPLLTSIITATAPASWPEIQGMRAHGVDEEAYFENYLTLRQRFTDDGLIFDVYGRSIDIVRNHPSLTIQDGNVTLVFRNSESIGYIYPNRSRFHHGGLTIRPAINTEGDAPVFAPRDLLLNIHHSTGEPISTTHQIELELKGLQIVSASPIPTRDDGTNLAWIFPAGETAEDVEVRVRPRLGTSLLLWTGLGFVIPPFNILPGLIRSLSLVSVLITALFMLHRMQTAQLQPSIQQAVADLRNAAIWALILTFGIQLIFYIFRYIGLSTNAIINLPTLVLYVLLLMFWYKSGPSSKRRKLLFVLFSLLYLLPPIVLILYIEYLPAQIEIDPPNVPWGLLGGWTLIALLSIGLITYLVLAGIINFIAVLWRGDWMEGLKARVKISPRWLPWLSTGLYFLSFLIVFFWLAFQIENLGGSVLLNISLKDPEIGQEVWLTIFNQVREESQVFAQDMLGSASALLPFIGLVGVLGLLFELSKISRNVYFPAGGEWGLGLATLLFAGFVVGTRGALLGLRIPIGFLLALAILRVTLSNWVRMAEQQIRENNPKVGHIEPLLPAFRKEFLLRARALETLDRQQAVLYEEHSNGKIDDAAYETKKAKLQADRDRLTYGDNPIVSPQKINSASSVSQEKNSLISWLACLFRPTKPPATTQQSLALLRLPKGISPNRIALSLGPGDNWWENASEAVDIGWKLALIPVGFYVYVLFSENVLVWLSPQTDFGVFLLLGGVLKEIAFWLTAAFVLGCLYPYLPGINGVLKGAFLTGVWLASVLAVQLIGTGEDPGWFFRFLQLLLLMALVGVGLDLQTLLRNGIYWRYILDYYQLRDVKTVIGYLSPLILTLIAVTQQIFSGQALQAITEIIKNLPQTIPLF